MITAAIRTVLVSDEAVSDLVGENIFHHAADENVRQAHIVITKVSAESPRTMDGQANYTRGTVAIDVYAPDMPTLKAIAAAITEALDNLNGNVAGLMLAYLELTSDRDQTTKPADGQAITFYSSELQFAYMFHS